MMTIMIMEVMGAHKGKEFTKELGRLGRQMMKNRFVFETFLSQAGRGGVKLIFEVQGEGVKPIEKRIKLDQFFANKK